MAEARIDTAPNDTATAGAQQSGAARRSPHVVAIASGKGGVGKSSVTVNLGLSLAKLGERVCIFDADTGLANINILLGLTPRFSLEHVLFGAKAIEEVMLESAHGMRVIPGANGISECVSLHPRQQLRLTRELARIENDYDYFLIDTAAGIADTTLDFICSAQTVLVVITPEPTSLTDAFSLLKLLHRRRRNLAAQVLVNMCASTAQAREVFHRFSAAVEKYIGLRSRYLGFLMRDESLRAAVTLQSPVALFPDSDPSSRSFLRLAEALEQSLRDEPPKSGFSSFWLRRFRERHAATARPAAVPAAAAGQTDAAYLAELKSRLLLLLEQEGGQQRLGRLLRELHGSFLQRYRQSAIDLVPLIETLTQSPERNERLLRQLAQRLKPWVQPEVVAAPVDLPALPLQSPPVQAPLLEAVYQSAAVVEAVPVAVVPAIASPAVVAAAASMTSITPSQTLSSDAPHRFDEQRFGSQQALIELLRRKEGERSVLELIDLL